MIHALNREIFAADSALSPLLLKTFSTFNKLGCGVSSDAPVLLQFITKWRSFVDLKKMVRVMVENLQCGGGQKEGLQDGGVCLCELMNGEPVIVITERWLPSRSLEFLDVQRMHPPMRPLRRALSREQPSLRSAFQRAAWCSRSSIFGGQSDNQSTRSSPELAGANSLVSKHHKTKLT